MEEKKENGKIVKKEIGEGFIHEARKKFRTIQEAIEAACGNSYSLKESDIDILYDVSSIEEAEEIIEEYYDGSEGSWNLPHIATVYSYDDPENGLQIKATPRQNEDAKYAKIVDDTKYADYAIEQYPNAIAYSTSTGINQLVLREEVDDDGNIFYTAIYNVYSRNLVQQSSAMQAFHEDGWECRCISVPILEHYSSKENIIDASGIWEYGKMAFMFDSELSPEDIKTLNELDKVDISDARIRMDAAEDVIIKHILERFGKVTPLKKVVFGDGNHSYELPDQITGPIFEGSIGSRCGNVIILDAEAILQELEPVTKAYEWVKETSEYPPTEEILRAMDEKAKQQEAELWTDADAQLQITRRIIEEAKRKREYRIQDISEGICPRQGEIDEVLNETIERARQNENTGLDGQTHAE